MKVICYPIPESFTLRTTCESCAVVLDADLYDLTFMDGQAYYGGPVVEYTCPRCARRQSVSASQVPRRLWRCIKGHG